MVAFIIRGLIWLINIPSMKSQTQRSSFVWRWLNQSVRPLKTVKPNKPKKRILAVLCVALTGMCVPATAGVFDSLLNILLPFYKGNKEKKQETTAETVPDQQDQPPMQAIQDETEQHVDDGSDDSYVFDDTKTTPIYDASASNLPSILLDDTLTAGDTSPVLGELDLYALLYAEFAADRGNIQEALKIYKAESFKKNATAVFERALSLSIEYEQPSESLAFAHAWQLKNPEHIPAWFYVAHLALKAKDYRQAATTLATILAYDNKADLTQILTGIFPTDPNDQRALFFALQELDDDSDNVSLSVLRAGLLMRLGNYPPALLHINKALKSEPSNWAFISLKMDILKMSGQTEDLWRFVRAKRQELPQEKELYLYEIRQLIENGELAKAWELLLVANQNTQDPDVALLASLVGLDIGEYSKAAEILTPLLNHHNFTSRAHYYLGVGYERSGDIDNARYHYERVKDYEHVLDARNKVVAFYLLDGAVDKAIATLVRLRDEYEVYTTDSYILQAEILLRQGKQQAAQDLLTSANREYPDDDRLLFASFKLLEKELSDDDKRLTIDRLLQIDPENLEYQLSDVKLRLIKNPNDIQAINIATKISKIGISEPNYDESAQLAALMVLASHALTQGEYQTVINYLQTPYEVKPELNVGIMLLRAYQGLGQNDKVVQLLGELQSRFAFGQQDQVEIQEY